ncbi:hypothetical protein Y1Q_0007296 [Alligator mississippiensis]|uniref:ribonuclease H n=1 Tax=Alligator mississippiensis TaxID=8496 RepID=A0A151NN19_ALLMI|nr:hypothetical protein Y1Q_0007296 [Alligator mississippiensis]
MLLGRDWTPIYDVLDRVRDTEVAHKKIQDRVGWLGEIEENKGSADEADELDLSDLTSSLLFREAQEEDPEIGALREQAQKLVERIEDSRYISTLDLAKGYWHLPVAKEDRLKTAFGTPWGLNEFIRMPFGLHGAAATFQRLMDQILAPHAEYAAAYIDDIVIYTRTWEQHKSTLRAILTELRHTGLTANPRKCALAQKETKYLGFLVGRGMIKPLADKVETIHNFTAPQDCRQLQSFLGLTNYYRRFVPHFAELPTPLSEALKGRKTGAVRWTREMAQSFERLKMALCEDVIIHTPDFRKPFILQTDTSETAVGAVLTQEEEGSERPVTYASRKLLPAEKRYATIDHECLAIQWAVDHFRYYLMGREFKLITDHAPLKWLSTAKTDNARITQWALALQPYKFYIIHWPRKTNTVADFLSRCRGEDQTGGQGGQEKGWTDTTGTLEQYSLFWMEYF